MSLDIKFFVRKIRIDAWGGSWNGRAFIVFSDSLTALQRKKAVEVIMRKIRTAPLGVVLYKIGDE